MLPPGLRRSDSILSTKSNNKKFTGLPQGTPELPGPLTRRQSLTKQASLMGNQMDISPKVG